MSRCVLALNGRQHRELKAHLFPGDVKEAAAILLCRDVGLRRPRLVAHSLMLVPHAECVRERDFLTWPGAQAG